MAFNKADIHKLARLARLELTDQEAEMLAPQMERILGFVEQMSELDTEDVEPMTTALEVVNRWASDAVGPSLTREAALQNAPKRDQECFLVPPVLGSR